MKKMITSQCSRPLKRRLIEALNRRNDVFMRIILVLISVFLTACATSLTSQAKNLAVVNMVSSELVSNCVPLGSVVGYAKPGWGNDIGLQQAMNDALNKAAAIPGASTFAVSNKQRSFSGGQVNGIAYDCNRERVTPVAIVQDDSGDIDSDIFLKAKKCQKKGGVWVESQCVIDLE